MGLDGVEIIMGVEERFRVRLPDAACSRVRTVADLAALVLSQLPKGTGVCHTAHSFYEVRNLLATHASIERRRIRPRARLADLLAPNQRRLWTKLRKRDRRLPGLVAKDRHDRAFLWLCAILAVAWLVAAAALWGAYGGGLALAASAAALVIGVLALENIDYHCRRHLPVGIETVGDLARAIVPIEMPRSGPGERLIAQQRVLDEVRRITAEQLGLPLERVLPESDFVKDLGAG
jgi:acyl carrier protein